MSRLAKSPRRGGAALGFAVLVIAVAAFFGGRSALEAATGKVELAMPLVVMIKSSFEGASETIGAGFLIGRGEGRRVYIATANHVVYDLEGEAPAKSIAIETKFSPAKLSGKRLKSDFLLDLAVLEVEFPEGVSLDQIPFDRLADPRYPLVEGALVFPIGYPGGEKWFAPTNPGVVSRHGALDSAGLLEFEGVEVIRGYSGGGLFDQNWELVGMVQSHKAIVSAARDVHTILDRAREWGFKVELEAVLNGLQVDAFPWGRITGVKGPEGTDVLATLPAADRLHTPLLLELPAGRYTVEIEASPEIKGSCTAVVPASGTAHCHVDLDEFDTNRYFKLGKWWD